MNTSHWQPMAWTSCPESEVIKLFSYSTQLSIKFFLLINIKMPTIVGILIFISGTNFMLISALQEKSLKCWYWFFYKQNKFHSQLSWSWKRFYNLGPSSADCTEPFLATYILRTGLCFSLLWVLWPFMKTSIFLSQGNLICGANQTILVKPPDHLQEA